MCVCKEMHIYIYKYIYIALYSYIKLSNELQRNGISAHPINSLFFFSERSFHWPTYVDPLACLARSPSWMRILQALGLKPLRKAPAYMEIVHNIQLWKVRLVFNEVRTTAQNIVPYYTSLPNPKYPYTYTSWYMYIYREREIHDLQYGIQWNKIRYTTLCHDMFIL